MIIHSGCCLRPSYYRAATSAVIWPLLPVITVTPRRVIYCADSSCNVPLFPRSQGIRNKAVSSFPFLLFYPFASLPWTTSRIFWKKNEHFGERWSVNGWGTFIKAIRLTIDIYLGINFENFQKFISCASYSKIMKLDQRDFNEVVEIGYVTCIIYTEINFSSPCNFIKENFSNKEESTYTMVVKNICTSSYFSSKHSFLFRHVL